MFWPLHDIGSTNFVSFHQSRVRKGVQNRGVYVKGNVALESRDVFWTLHDIGSTNFVWCIAYTREVGKGIVYCPINVQ